jgi:hypothetical protein
MKRLPDLSLIINQPKEEGNEENYYEAEKISVSNGKVMKLLSPYKEHWKVVVKQMVTTDCYTVLRTLSIHSVVTVQS